MSPRTRKRFQTPGALAKSRSAVVALILVNLLGLAWAPSTADAQQAQPTPERPLLLIGGTFVGYDFEGAGDAPGWGEITSWLAAEGGYTPGSDLFIGEMARQLDQPPDWPSQLLLPWPRFLADVEEAGGSTAGLASMDDSTATVASQILLVARLTQADEIDVIAHSQAPAIARSAIRHLEADPDVDNPVRTLVSLGGEHYGISSLAPEFHPDVPFWGPLISASGLALCRSNAWVPVCSDIVRRSPFTRPDPSNPDPNLFVTDFYPRLNAPANPSDPNDPGPVPASTSFFHFYSSIFEEGGGEERYAGETIELFPNEPNVQNVSVQNFCLLAGVEGYAVHHSLQWGDPAMREMMLHALGIRTADPSVCW